MLQFVFAIGAVLQERVVFSYGTFMCAEVSSPIEPKWLPEISALYTDVYMVHVSLPSNCVDSISFIFSCNICHPREVRSILDKERPAVTDESKTAIVFFPLVISPTEGTRP